YGTLQRLLQGIQILQIEVLRTIPNDMTSPATLLVSLFDVETPEEQATLVSRIMSAIQTSGDESIQTIEVRFHNRQNHWIGGISVPREQAQAFREQRLTQQDLIQSFVQLTPSPSPLPTPTPTPD